MNGGKIKYHEVEIPMIEIAMIVKIDARHHR